MTTQAAHAIRAAQIYRTCGRYAARRYAEKHGVTRLYYLARQLAAVTI